MMNHDPKSYLGQSLTDSNGATTSHMETKYSNHLQQHQQDLDLKYQSTPESKFQDTKYHQSQDNKHQQQQQYLEQLAVASGTMMCR